MHRFDDEAHLRPDEFTPRPGLTAIYGLYDPAGELRYIGKSINPLQRWRLHCARKGWRARDMLVPVNKWSAELRETGDRPAMRVFTWARDWESAERALIAAHRKAGAKLLNVHPGGRPQVIPPSGQRGRTIQAQRSPLLVSAMTVLDRRCRELGQPAQTLIKSAMASIRAVRRRIQREGTPSDVARFDANLHSHAVLGRVKDFPVLPFDQAYDRCWTRA